MNTNLESEYNSRWQDADIKARAAQDEAERLHGLASDAAHAAANASFRASELYAARDAIKAEAIAFANSIGVKASPPDNFQAEAPAPDPEIFEPDEQPVAAVLEAEPVTEDLTAEAITHAIVVLDEPAYSVSTHDRPRGLDAFFNAFRPKEPA